MKTRKLAIVEEPQTPAPIKSKFEKLTYLADDFIRSADYALAKFTERFAKNPAYAFEWSASAFQAAAEQSVGLTIRSVFRENEEKSEEERADYVLSEALNRAMGEARNPSHSTSVQSNEMARAMASAWAKVYQKVERGMF